MKGKLAAGGIIVLVAVVVLIQLGQNRSQGKKESQMPTKTDFSTAERLPGFNSRRKENPVSGLPEIDPDYPTFDVEPVVIKRGDRFEDLSPEEVARIEEGQRQIAKIIARQEQDSFEGRLGSLVSGLDLDASQENRLRAHFEEIQNDILTGDLQAHGTLQRLLAGEGLDEVLEGILTPEQLASRESREEGRRTAKVEKEVAVEVNHLNSLLALNADQATRVQEVLKNFALDSGGSESAGARAEEQLKISQELAAQFQQAEPGTNPMRAFIQERLNRTREEKLDQLRGVLSESQIERYRESLQSRDEGLLNFQNSLNAFDRRRGQ